MIFQITHTILSAFGILVNGFMMYLALTKSPKIMRPCSVIITIKTATDILASLSSFFVMQRIITDGTSIFIIPTGPCTRISPIACYSGHMFMICFLEHNLIWMISSYIFRYYILYVRDPSVQTLCLTACCLSIPSLIHISTWISFYEPVEFSTELTKIVELHPNDIVLGGSIIYWSTLVLMVQLFFTAFLVVLTYFWIRDVLVSFSTKMGGVTLELRHLNRVLVKIVTFQVFLPSFTFLGVLILVGQYTRVISFIYSQYLISIVFMFSPIFSPFSYMLFVPHYRNVLFFTRKRADSREIYSGKKRMSTSIINTNSTITTC